MGLAKVTLIGNVGKPEDLKYTQSGKALINFSLAVNDGKGDQQTTTWYRCALFGQLAESLAPYIVKGKQVYVEGKLTAREYEGKNGKGFSLDVDVREIQLLGSRGSEGEPEAANGSHAPNGGDIPF